MSPQDRARYLARLLAVAGMFAVNAAVPAAQDGCAYCWDFGGSHLCQPLWEQVCEGFSECIPEPWGCLIGGECHLVPCDPGPGCCGSCSG
jgi:hypothetical protein